MTNAESPRHTPIALDRDRFMRQLIASLGYLNEGILGSGLAGAYIMQVGLSMGAAIEAEYKRYWGIERPFTLEEYAHVIVDLKQKIQGNFSLVSQSAQEVVVRTTSCPFDEFVRQSPSLCFMTSSVFGGIAARNFGYAKVALQQRIALGDPGCYVTVYLQRTPEAQAAVGKEYFPDLERASPDIAEQLRLMDQVRQLRTQLVERTEHWEELVQGAAEAICLVDREARIAFANARWRDLLGVEAEELIGLPIAQLEPADSGTTVHDALQRGLAGQRVVGTEGRLRHRSGHWREVQVSTSPFRDESGGVRGALGIVRDVTEERAAQRFKDEFLSVAAHELRTPVTTIMGMAQVLRRSLERGDPTDPARLGSRLQLIQQEADRLARLSHDLLDTARLQAGRLLLSPELCDLRDLVEEVVEHQRTLLPSAPGYALVLQQPTSPVLVRVEAERIRQVLTNLLDNAVKYSPQGGTILVRTEAEDAGARVLIQDPGIGIPPAELPQLGEPFFRASNASSRSFTGIGMGLHLCRGLVEAHGGALTIESQEGRGTTVQLSLPLVDHA